MIATTSKYCVLQGASPIQVWSTRHRRGHHQIPLLHDSAPPTPLAHVAISRMKLEPPKEKLEFRTHPNSHLPHFQLSSHCFQRRGVRFLCFCILQSPHLQPIPILASGHCGCGMFHRAHLYLPYILNSQRPLCCCQLLAVASTHYVCFMIIKL